MTNAQFTAWFSACVPAKTHQQTNQGDSDAKRLPQSYPHIFARACGLPHLCSYLTGVASQVYKGALYLYAAEGVIPAPYSREMLDMAWKFKKS